VSTNLLSTSGRQPGQCALTHCPADSRSCAAAAWRFTLQRSDCRRKRTATAHGLQAIDTRVDQCQLRAHISWDGERLNLTIRRGVICDTFKLTDTSRGHGRHECMHEHPLSPQRDHWLAVGDLEELFIRSILNNKKHKHAHADESSRPDGGQFRMFALFPTLRIFPV
jgi:hypothetical protein